MQMRGPVLIVVAAASVPASAQFAPLPGAAFVENTKARTAISGGIVVGVTAKRAPKSRGRNYLWVRPLQNFTGDVRVRALTEDGSYEGKGEFSGTANAKQWTNVLSLRSGGNKGAGKIRNGRNDALFTTIAETGRGATNRVILTAWTETPAPPEVDEVQVAFKNLSFGARISIILPAGQKRACQPGFGKGAGITYNTLCVLTLTELDRLNAITIESRTDEVAQFRRAVI